jgi:prepilin-type N-terminal cleavage/methylation domain-containing protein
VKRRRSGFTLIEMLVVIGVILILMVMAVIGYQVVERSVAANQTRTTLENLNAMLSEFDAAAGSTALPSYSYQYPNPSPPPAMLTAGPSMIGAGQVPNGISWTIGDVTSQGSGDRYNSLPVQKTASIIMAALLRIPNNSKAIAQLPSSKFLRYADGTPYTYGTVLLDGWDNPIIFVPPGGIVVNITTGSSTPTLVTITSRDNRPFFASAGPDGDFGAVTSPAPATGPTGGDDNVYSKQQ